MKVGLFICDHINPEYKDEFGDYPDMFAQLFPEFDFVFYDVCNGDFPMDKTVDGVHKSALSECDVYLATGSRHSVYENTDWIVFMKEVIRAIQRENKYFIGLCFGHQLLAEALGGKVNKSPNGWCVGVHRFEIDNERQSEWMNPFQSNINLLMMCQDQVMELPLDAKVLAGNASCPVGMFQVGERMLGIQAHPEFTKKYNQTLMEARVERIGVKGVQEGIESLDLEVHQKTIHDWILNFVGYQ